MLLESGFSSISCGTPGWFISEHKTLGQTVNDYNRST